MSHHVPEFDLDEFCPAPTSGQSRQKNMQDDDDNNDHKIMELVWHSGQPAVQNKSSSQRLSRIPSPPQHHMLPSPPTEQQPPPPLQPQSHLFMQEDEMTSWLHYPLEDDTSFDQHISDLLYHPPGPGPSAAPPPPSSSACALPPQPPPPPKLPPPQRHHQFFRHQTRPQPRPPAHPSAPVGVNFPQFARLKPRLPESGASSNNNKLRESTVVDSSDTLKSSFLPVSSSPAVKLSRRESINDSAAIAATSAVGGGGGSSMSMNMDTDTYGCSRSDGSATATMDLMGRRPSHDRKRKGFESTDTYTGTESEDVAVESYDMKKQCRGTAFGKRSRAAEVHNLSERKRRDKINEKMKALQELIPRCTKTDKASMLDEAIEYMKSLQMQLQMMSAGYYGMVPMMFPGVQQYMPMGMGMEMRMNRPMVPFPIQTPGASSSIEPRFQFPAFHTPPIPTFHPVNVQTNQMQTNQMEPVGNLNCPSDANVYQQYLGAQQMPLQHIFENPPPISTPSTSKASTSTSKEAEDHENHPSGTDMHYSHNK